jgi:hypothetical protein
MIFVYETTLIITSEGSNNKYPRSDKIVEGCLFNYLEFLHLLTIRCTSKEVQLIEIQKFK